MPPTRLPSTAISPTTGTGAGPGPGAGPGTGAATASTDGVDTSSADAISTPFLLTPSLRRLHTADTGAAATFCADTISTASANIVSAATMPAATGAVMCADTVSTDIIFAASAICVHCIAFITTSAVVACRGRHSDDYLCMDRSGADARIARAGVHRTGVHEGMAHVHFKAVARVCRMRAHGLYPVEVWRKVGWIRLYRTRSVREAFASLCTLSARALLLRL